MSNYKISIIVPIYNTEKYLENMINNVINQTIGFENIELFLIDDKSTDSSRDIILKYSKKYNNIIPIFLESNSGTCSYPRNVALDKVTAPYIIYLDSDDEMYKDYCEVLYNTINKSNADIVTCRHTSKLNNELYISKEIETINYDTRVLDNDEKMFVNVSVWGKIYRTSFLKENKIQFLEILFEDHEFVFYCLINTEKNIIDLPNYPGYIYLIENNNSITHTADNKTLNDFLKAINHTYNSIENYCSLEIKIKLMNTLINAAFFILLKLKNPKKGIETLYQFENKLDIELFPTSAPLRIINNRIRKKQFNRSLILIKLMSILYNNNRIYKYVFINYTNNKKLNDSRYP